MTWILLAGAVAAEIAGTLALRAGVAGRPWLIALVVVGYVTAFALFAGALRTLDVGPAYAIWSGVGTVGATAGGWLLFDERFGPMVALGIALVVAGVVVITLGGGVTHA